MSDVHMSSALLFRDRRPRRSSITFFTRWYSIIVALFASVLFLLATWPHELALAVVLILLYWLYVAVKVLVIKGRGLQTWYASRSIQFARAFFLVLAVSAVLSYLYLYRHVSQQAYASNTLWLLFLLASFVVSQHGSTKQMLSIVVLAAACLLVLDILVASSAGIAWFTLAHVSGVASRVIWLALLSSILHTLIRYVGNSYANVRLLHGIQEKLHLFELQGTHESPQTAEGRILQAAVEFIAADFGYPHVNVFFKNGDDTLSCVAVSSARARSLIENNFRLSCSQGIVGYVSSSGNTHLSNNVDKDAKYYRHPAFPRTKSELAVPIIVRDQLLGVLDIQAHQKGFFLSQDLEVLEIASGYLGRVIENARMLRWKQEVSEIVESLAHRFLSQHELEGTLNSIAQAAYEELNADIVALYQLGPASNDLSAPVLAGQLKHPEAMSGVCTLPDTLVHRLLSAEEDFYFIPDVPSKLDDPLFGRSASQAQFSEPGFAEREEIRSRATIRLRAGDEVLGLILLNYRNPRTFGERDELVFRTFSHFAALALQKAEYYGGQQRREREELAQRLHDQLFAEAYGAYRITTTVLSNWPPTDSDREKLSLARDALQELQSDIGFLKATLEDTLSHDLLAEAAKVGRRAEVAYGIVYGLEWRGKKSHYPPRVVAEIKLILNEAILNAVRHGRAHRIDLACDTVAGRLAMRIQDDGLGFDPAYVTPRGLRSIHERVTFLGGECSIQSAPGAGTYIDITIPGEQIGLA